MYLRDFGSCVTCVINIRKVMVVRGLYIIINPKRGEIQVLESSLTLPSLPFLPLCTL